MANMFGLSKLNTKKLCEKYVNALKKYPYEQSDIVHIALSEYKGKTICPKAYYEGERRKCFESNAFRIPKEAEKILSNEYGDYMKLPPKAERKPKHNIQLLY